MYCELVSMFKDRLASEEDAEKFETILRHALRKIGNKDVSWSNTRIVNFLKIRKFINT